MKRNCLIVDDEAPARKIIESIVDWKSIGFNSPDLARNGKEAFELSENKVYDVIFTDIQMPIMNGIQLIEKIKINNPSQKFIIVSCHESFEYAKKAMRLGVSDYIIKDLMTKNEIQTLLIGMFADENIQETDEYSNENNLILLDYIQGKTCDEKTLLNFIGHNEDGEGVRKLVGFYISISNKNDSDIDLYVEALMANFKGFAKITNRHFFILMSKKVPPSNEEYISNVTVRANQIRSIGNKNGVKAISIGISQLKSKDLRQIYETAKEACDMKVFLGLDRNIFFDTIDNKRGIYDKDSIKEKLNSFKKALKNNNEVRTSLNEIFIGGYSGVMQVNYYHYINDSIVGIIFDYIRDNDCDWELLREKGFQLSTEDVYYLETVEEMKNYIERAVKILNNIGFSTFDNSIIDKVIRFINKNVHKSISLSMIADEFHFNKSYLSRIFKVETGQNIVQYITDCKITKAKEYLSQTDMRLSEISNSLSFSNQQYFSIIFKKETGLTPIEFKKNSKQ